MISVEGGRIGRKIIVDVCHMVQLQTQRDFPDIVLKINKATMVGEEKTETISSRIEKENRGGKSSHPSPFSTRPQRSPRPVEYPSSSYWALPGC